MRTLPRPRMPTEGKWICSEGAAFLFSCQQSTKDLFFPSFYWYFKRIEKEWREQRHGMKIAMTLIFCCCCSYCSYVVEQTLSLLFRYCSVCMIFSLQGREFDDHEICFECFSLFVCIWGSIFCKGRFFPFLQ